MHKTAQPLNIKITLIKTNKPKISGFWVKAKSHWPTQAMVNQQQKIEQALTNKSMRSSKTNGHYFQITGTKRGVIVGHSPPSYVQIAREE